jgi:hypothetical protein
MTSERSQIELREERIASLSDQQALAIVDLIAGEYADMETPAGEKEQRAALDAAFRAAGVKVDLSQSTTADIAAAGRAARELLRVMAQAPDLHASLDGWLEEPPRQETLAVPLLIAVPAVFAGCIALLQVLGPERRTGERLTPKTVGHLRSDI